MEVESSTPDGTPANHVAFRQLEQTASQLAENQESSAYAASKGDPEAEEGVFRLLENNRVSASGIAECITHNLTR